MKLHRVSSQNLRLRKLVAGGPHLGHARLELCDIIFQIHAWWWYMKVPCVNAACHMMETGANIQRQASQFRLKLERIPILAAILYRNLQRHQGVKERAAKLRQHAKSLTPSRAA